MRRTLQVPRWLYFASGIVIIALAAFFYYRSVADGSEIHSLAVLPFTNANADLQAEYLSDGITESIINNLSQLHRVRVMARTTVFQYKGKQSHPQDVGRQLHVDAVVTGNVNKRGDTITVQSVLVNTRDGSQIWGDQFSGKSDDLLSLQSEISTVISQKLRLNLTGEEKKLVAKRYTGNPEAYQLYLKGRYEWSKFTADGTRKAIE